MAMLKWPEVAAFAGGHVTHHRFQPKHHRFRYRMRWCLVDVDRLDDLPKHSRLWGVNRWNVFSLRQTDYVNAQARSISSKIREFVAEHSQAPFSGRILLFTHPRTLGIGFNSVNFYFGLRGHELQFIVSEINNTPWGEKHLYWHDCQAQNQPLEPAHEFHFDKAFHISPFLPMAMNYEWRFTCHDDGLDVLMKVKQEDVVKLSVVLKTEFEPFWEQSHWRQMLSQPFQPWKMWLGIYWQALKLKLKNIPFYDHPKTRS